VLEALVGMMRPEHEERADKYSVELYLKKFEGLLIGFDRIEPKRLNN